MLKGLTCAEVVYQNRNGNNTISNLPSPRGDSARQPRVINHLQCLLHLSAITHLLCSPAGNKKVGGGDGSLNWELSWIWPRNTLTFYKMHHISVFAERSSAANAHIWAPVCARRGSGERDQLCTSLRMTPREAGGSSHYKRGFTI